MRRLTAVASEISLLLFGLTVAALAATYPLIRHMTTHLPNDAGDPVLVAWTLGWDAEAFRHGISRLFDAPNFFPYTRTLAYSDHLLGLAIFTAPVQWLTANPVLTYNIAFVASFVQAGIGMYLLARELTGRRDAAALAAVAYAFAPFRIAHLAHLQWLTTGWLPMSLWALHRYFSTRALSYLLACAAAYLLQSLTATYFTYFALLPLAAVALVEAWRTRPPLWRTVAHAAAAGALCAAILAPVAYEYLRVRADQDFRRNPAEITALSADLGDYLRGHNHIWLWRHARPGTGEHELFPGAIVLLLAGAAAFAPRSAASPRIRLYATIAAGALLLSLGPRPTAWGHPAPFPGPYQLALDLVPGIDGLRSVSRLGVIVVLAVCVLGAYGAARLLDRLPTGTRAMFVVVLGLGIISEAWAAPIPTVRFTPLANTDDRDAYGFLKASGPGAVLELPMWHADDPRELRYQYLTLWHGHRIVNGSSSYVPALTQLLAGEHSPLTDASRPAAAIGLVRALGVRYLVVHRGTFPDPSVEGALLRTLDNDREQVVGSHPFGRTIVFTLAEDARPGAVNGRMVAASAIHARASHSPDRLPLLFDGDRDTRWLTGEPQHGAEWIELALDSPRDIRVVRMQTAERSFGDLPRELAIDVVEDGRTRTLFHGSVLPQFGRGFAADHAYPIIDIDLVDNHAQVVRLRQLGTADTMFWSIHQLELWEQPATR